MKPIDTQNKTRGWTGSDVRRPSEDTQGEELYCEPCVAWRVVGETEAWRGVWWARQKRRRIRGR